MTGRRGKGLSVLSAALCVGCSSTPFSLVEQRSDRLIYGDDGRRDWYQVDDDAWRTVATESTVALIDARFLVRAEPGDFEVRADSIGDVASLCPSEPFRMQPAAASCSGVLVDDRLVLTAGHCVSDDTLCDDQVWAFNYAITAPGFAPLLHREDLYSCRSVVYRTRTIDSAGRRWDFSFIELDRPVAPTHRPADILAMPEQTDDPLSVIGYPGGLPVKVDSGVRVLDARIESSDFFTMDSDTFQGSSGSGVFDEARKLRGIMVRGGTDYVYQSDLGCFVSRHVDDVVDTSKAEQASYVAPALDCLCASGWQSERLCPFGEGSQSCAAGLPTRLSPSGGCGFVARSPQSAYWRLLACWPLAIILRRRKKTVPDIDPP